MSTTFPDSSSSATRSDDDTYNNNNGDTEVTRVTLKMSSIGATSLSNAHNNEVTSRERRNYILTSFVSPQTSEHEDSKSEVRCLEETVRRQSYLLAVKQKEIEALSLKLEQQNLWLNDFDKIKARMEESLTKELNRVKAQLKLKEEATQYFERDMTETVEKLKEELLAANARIQQLEKERTELEERALNAESALEAKDRVNRYKIISLREKINHLSEFGRRKTKEEEDLEIIFTKLEEAISHQEAQLEQKDHYIASLQKEKAIIINYNLDLVHRYQEKQMQYLDPQLNSLMAGFMESISKQQAHTREKLEAVLSDRLEKIRKENEEWENLISDNSLSSLVPGSIGTSGVVGEDRSHLDNIERIRATRDKIRQINMDLQRMHMNLVTMSRDERILAELSKIGDAQSERSAHSIDVIKSLNGINHELNLQIAKLKKDHAEQRDSLIEAIEAEKASAKLASQTIASLREQINVLQQENSQNEKNFEMVIESLNSTVSNLRTKIELLHAEFTAKEAANKDNELALNRTITDLNELLETTIRTASERETELLQRLSTATEEIERLKSDEVMNQKEQQLLETIFMLNEDIERLKRERDELDNRLQQVGTAVTQEPSSEQERLFQQSFKAKEDEYEAKIRSLSESIEALNAEIRTLKEARVQTETAEESAERKSKEEYEALVARMKEGLAARDRALEELKANLAAERQSADQQQQQQRLPRESSSSSDDDGMTAELETLKAKAQDAEMKLNQASQTIAQLQSALDAKEADISDTKKKYQHLHDELEATKSELAASRAVLEKLQSATQLQAQQQMLAAFKNAETALYGSSTQYAETVGHLVSRIDAQARRLSTLKSKLSRIATAIQSHNADKQGQAQVLAECQAKLASTQRMLASSNKDEAELEFMLTTRGELVAKTLEVNTIIDGVKKQIGGILELDLAKAAKKGQLAPRLTEIQDRVSQALDRNNMIVTNYLSQAERRSIQRESQELSSDALRLLDPKEDDTASVVSSATTADSPKASKKGKIFQMKRASLLTRIGRSRSSSEMILPATSAAASSSPSSSSSGGDGGGTTSPARAADK